MIPTKYTHEPNPNTWPKLYHLETGSNTLGDLKSCCWVHAYRSVQLGRQTWCKEHACWGRRRKKWTFLIKSPLKKCIVDCLLENCFQRNIMISLSTNSQSWGTVPKTLFHPLNPHQVNWFCLSVHYLVKTDHVEHFRGGDGRWANGRKNELSWLSLLLENASLIACWETMENHFPKKYRDSQFYKIPIMGGTVPKILSIP